MALPSHYYVFNISSLFRKKKESTSVLRPLDSALKVGLISNFDNILLADTIKQFEDDEYSKIPTVPTDVQNDVILPQKTPNLSTHSF